jgi:peptidoglycan/LPS O-acetylase OafA/YrhL
MVMKREVPSLGHVGALDGVRGVAVLLVFLFHLKVFGFGAGYLGVDIFFVLSGFLITSLLLAEMKKTGKISVTAFWARRARRLMPALIVLLFMVTFVTHLTATFSQRSSMRGDLLATTTYVANWHFIATGSYFNNTGTISPLQHTWSLGIEEQFYLFWPLLLAIIIPITRRPRSSVAALAALGTVLSALALGMLWSAQSPDRAYMGTDARIFEPLIGALGAAFLSSPAGRAFVERVGTRLVTFGFLGLIAGLGLIRSDTSLYFFGGAIAISIATLMVVAPLWLGRGGRLQRGLEWRPLAWLGVISYGVYLWHWPLMLWLGVPQARGLGRLLSGSLAMVLTIGMAAFSYYLIERPIRTGRQIGRHVRRNDVLQRRIVLLTVPLAMVATACASVAATTVPPPAPGVPVIMLAGDSVPLRLGAALERAAGSPVWRIVSALSGGCPVSGEAHVLYYDPTRESAKCPGVPARQDALIRSMHPNIVVWWDRWSVSSFVTAGGKHVTAGSPLFWKLRRAALARAVDRLTRDGAMVVFVATEPPGEGIMRRCTSEHCDGWVRFQIEHYRDVTSRWNEIMRIYATRHPDLAAFVSLTETVCRSDRAPCNDLIDGVPARPDGTHYEGAGEQEAAATLVALLTPIVARTNL